MMNQKLINKRTFKKKRCPACKKRKNKLHKSPCESKKQKRKQREKTE